MKRRIALGCLCWFLAFSPIDYCSRTLAVAEFRFAGQTMGISVYSGLWSSIVKAGTNQMALDLSNDVEVPYCHDARSFGRLIRNGLPSITVRRTRPIPATKQSRFISYAIINGCSSIAH